MRVSTIIKSSSSSLLSLRNDLEKFIHPLARNLRYGTAGIPHIELQKQKQDENNNNNNNNNNKREELEYNKQKYFSETPTRSPGIRTPVTYFSSRMNTLLNRPLNSSSSLLISNIIDVTVPLYRCPICFQAETINNNNNNNKRVSFMTPLEITRHMSWMHAASASSQSNFTIFNNYEMQRLFHALPSSANMIINNKEKEKLENNNNNKEIENVEVEEGSSTGKARIVVLLDVANIELSAEDALVELLTNEESLIFFNRVPCAFVCVHEVFIPHTSRPGHIFFQLSRLNINSDIFTFYAATRNESGDLVSASIMGDILLQNISSCGPAIVLLTRDRIQKSCVAEIFGGIAGRGGRVLLPRITTSNILSSLREANSMSMAR